ncbi:MAG: hypothetical protein H6551_04610 [Chitinophagales bacterium]|nr:hypothetical protein [Chitinophagaceae bacterium]MCB9064407.1 hypothetical protein [Chitinophagales bacterium]
MKRILQISALLLIATMFNACKKQCQNIAQKNAVGQYKFEKVVRHYDLLKTENRTGDYNNMILQLNDKNQAALIDQNNNITYTGKYEIYTDYYGNDDDGNSNVNYTIIIDLKGNGRGESDYYLYGENANIGRNKLYFWVRRGDGRYKFKLDKI